MTTYNSQAVSFTLKEVEFHYPQLAKAVTPRFGEDTGIPQYSVQVRGIDADTAADMKELGLPVKMVEDTFAITLKQYTQNAQGVAQTLNIVDADFNDIDPATIGYGSKGHVAGFMYQYNNANGQGYSLRMTDLVITELKEYTPETKEERLKRLFG